MLSAAGLQSGKGHMMMDSVVWAQYINMTDTQTDSHVAITNAVPMHRVVQQKSATASAGLVLSLHKRLNANCRQTEREGSLFSHD